MKISGTKQRSEYPKRMIPRGGVNWGAGPFLKTFQNPFKLVQFPSIIIGRPYRTLERRHGSNWGAIGEKGWITESLTFKIDRSAEIRSRFERGYSSGLFAHS